jgi:hypothetical protein
MTALALLAAQIIRAIRARIPRMPRESVEEYARRKWGLK